MFEREDGEEAARKPGGGVGWGSFGSVSWMPGEGQEPAVFLAVLLLRSERQTAVLRLGPRKDAERTRGIMGHPHPTCCLRNPIQAAVTAAEIQEAKHSLSEFYLLAQRHLSSQLFFPF